jgi:hypothetical protein
VYGDTLDERLSSETDIGGYTAHAIPEADDAIRELGAAARLVARMILQTRARVDQHEAACIDIHERIDKLIMATCKWPDSIGEKQQLCDSTNDLVAAQARSRETTRQLLATTRSHLERSAALSNEIHGELRRAAQAAAR